MEVQGNMVPMVIEQTGRGERAYDLWSRMMKDRIIFISGGINDDNANITVAQLLFLQSEDAEKEISIYINSPGGVCTAGLAVIDAMKFVKCPVATYCVGQAASMGAVILAAGTKGRRFSLPSSRIMIHQPWGGAEGMATDMEIQVKEIVRIKTQLIEILAEATGKTAKVLERDMDRDLFLSAKESVSYGLIDGIVGKKK